MSERDPTPNELAEALRVMADRKGSGEWDASRGDVPQRLGPLRVPAGCRTLSEMADRWAALNRGVLGADVGTMAERVLVRALAEGQLESFAVTPTGECHRIPRLVWQALLEEPGGERNGSMSVTLDCLTGGAFEPSYVGCMGVVTEAAFEKLSTAGAAIVEAGRDDAPWLPGTPTAWLSSEASGIWANARLREQGLRVDERGRRVEFGKAITHHRALFDESSVAKVRNRAGFTIRKGT